MTEVRGAATESVQPVLDRHFPGLVLRAPTFSAWPLALLFEINFSGRRMQQKYFYRRYVRRRVTEAQQRATKLYEACFDADDSGWIVGVGPMVSLKDSAWTDFLSLVPEAKREKIETRHGVDFYEEGHEDNVYRVVAVHAPLRVVDYLTLAAGIARQDHYMMIVADELVLRPGALHQDVWIVADSRPLVFHQYDDRGVDILAPTVGRLRPIYVEFRKWIVENVRPQIEATMGETA